MNDKERFHAIAGFEPCDRMLFWEQGFWGGAVERWYAEGMPRVHGVEGDLAYGDTARGPATPIAPGDRTCRDIGAAAGLDRPSLKVPVELFLCPAFEEEVLEAQGEQLVVRVAMGIVKQTRRERDSIPHFLSGPVSDWSDFDLAGFWSRGDMHDEPRVAAFGARVAAKDPDALRALAEAIRFDVFATALFLVVDRAEKIERN